MIEYEQRDGLKPLELAQFVQKRLALGDKQADIANNLGKSRQWVTLATALIEAPDWMQQAYREGPCLVSMRPPSRHGRLRSRPSRATASPPARGSHTDKRILVEFDGQDYQLVVSVAQDQPGHVYVRPLVGGPRRLAPASSLRLLGFVDG